MEYKPNNEGENYYSFTIEAINNNPVQKVLSGLIYNSDLAHDTAYEMLGSGLEVLDEVITSIDSENFKRDDDEIVEGISSQADSGTPVYNTDIMQFVSRNYSVVDEYTEQMGHGESIINDGMGAYCFTYESFINGLLDALINYMSE